MANFFGVFLFRANNISLIFRCHC